MTNERPSTKNVRQPSCDEDECHFCGDDNTAITIRGNWAANCNYCGNEIVMCQFCFSVVKKLGNEIIGELNDK